MLSGVSQFFQSIAAFPQAKEIVPGQTYTGVIRVQNGSLILTSGRLQIPIDDAVGLLSGQRVSFQLRSTTDGPQLTITPEQAPGGAVPPSPPNLARILAPILETLGKLDLAPRIHGMIPRHAPSTPVALRPLLAVLLSERALGADLERFTEVLSSGLSRGVFSPGTAAAIVQWLGLGPADDSGSWQALLLRSRQEQAVAARIAATIKDGSGQELLASLKDSAASLAERVLSEPEFLRALQEDGELENFKGLAHRIQERATGGELQNLRGLDQNYHFMELPLSESQGFHRAQIHTFHEKGSTGRSSGGTMHHTVLDIDTTRLGALWVALQSAGDQCNCQFRVEDADVAALIEAQAPTLEAALAAAGYGRVSVSATQWEGDREAALIAMLAPYQKLDLEA